MYTREIDTVEPPKRRTSLLRTIKDKMSWSQAVLYLEVSLYYVFYAMSSLICCGYPLGKPMLDVVRQ